MLTKDDLEALALLRDFLPKRAFDAHAHLTPERTPGGYVRDMGAILGADTLLQANFMPLPEPAMAEGKLRDQANERLVQALADAPGHTGCAYILPGDDEAAIYRRATLPGIRGLKCYCYGAVTQSYEDCSIASFLPQSAWEVAQALELPIILHMMRPGALSDEGNFAYLTAMTHRYPKARLVLAHCARGFASWTVVDKVKELEDTGSIWFDMAAICESAPIAACILKNAGKRTLWGTDYPICLLRGKPISMGTGFVWLTQPPFPPGARPCLVAVENLLAFRQAALLLGLDQTQLDDLFYRNALALFSLSQP